MSLPTIAIINFSDVPDPGVQDAIRAINRQVIEDFIPVWGSGYVSRLFAPAYDPADPDTLSEDPVSADGVIYLVDQAHLPGALGYHDMNASEVPVGFVFTDLGEWTVTLSHEVLEMIVDPTVNIFVPGPDPRHLDDPNRWLWHTYEVCDAVEATSYQIDGIELSNFVTPAYFRAGDAAGTRNDFLGVGVTSFGLLPNSHLGTVDPTAGYVWVTILGAEIPHPHLRKARYESFCTDRHRARLDDDDGLCRTSSYLAQIRDTWTIPIDGCGIPMKSVTL